MEKILNEINAESNENNKISVDDFEIEEMSSVSLALLQAEPSRM